MFHKDAKEHRLEAVLVNYVLPDHSPETGLYLCRGLILDGTPSVYHRVQLASWFRQVLGCLDPRMASEMRYWPQHLDNQMAQSDLKFPQKHHAQLGQLFARKPL